MKVLVGDPVPIKYSDAYVAEVRFVHGDADSYTESEYELDKDGVIQLTQFLVAYYNLPYNIRCCEHDAVTKLDWYWKIFTNAYSQEEFLSDEFPGEDYWPWDTRYDACCAQLDAVSIFYYNEDGSKHHVTVEKEAGDV